MRNMLDHIAALRMPNDLGRLTFRFRLPPPIPPAQPSAPPTQEEHLHRNHRVRPKPQFRQRQQDIVTLLLRQYVITR